LLWGSIIRFVFTLLAALEIANALAQPGGYVAAKTCAGCHSGIYETWKLTGMGRSFYPATPSEAVQDFYHQPSDTHYAMAVRYGNYYQRRWQVGFGGKEINAEELRVDFVMGSGNHARTYLSRTVRGTLIQLPLGWYSEKGGHWAMNPGYDTARPPSHRPIAYECMFCHNAYPDIPAGHEQSGGEPVYAGAMPEGIECQRCHGPGAKHVRMARGGAGSLEQIRASIVNPARLSKDRQMEVCMQCHLETTSARLPGIIRRFERGPFSYVSGQPLGEFVVFFARATGAGFPDNFDIAGGAYRLRQSQCFLKSKGELTCTTCHNPHDIPRGPAAVVSYARACRQCHAATVDRLNALGTHPSNPECVSCHMPKRRTEDAVHVVMTDHLIQRRPPSRDLLAALQERHPAPKDEYSGEVVPYYPSPLAGTPKNAVLTALAQIQHRSNLASGIERLSAALSRAPASSAEYYMALGDAWHSAGNPVGSVEAYRKATVLHPTSARALRYLGNALRESGQLTRASEALHSALQIDRTDAQVWFELGLLAAQQGKVAEAATSLEKASVLNPDLPDVWNSIGENRGGRGDALGATSAFLTALRIDPYFAAAHSNFARLLAIRGDREEALYHFDKAAGLQPANATNWYEYALTLVQLERFDDSKQKVELAVRADPNLAEAHELLGGLLARGKDMDAALLHYREAVRLKPEFSRAQFDLAAALSATGHAAEAKLHFREAAKSADPRIATLAAQALRQMGEQQ
jgi:tetratricopeptide (TPR) repeat protein